MNLMDNTNFPGVYIKSEPDTRSTIQKLFDMYEKYFGMLDTQNNRLIVQQDINTILLEAYNKGELQEEREIQVTFDMGKINFNLIEQKKTNLKDGYTKEELRYMDMIDTNED